MNLVRPSRASAWLRSTLIFLIMKKEFSLKYIQFLMQSDSVVLARFYINNSFYVFDIPILDHSRSYDCLAGIFGLMGRTCTGDFYCKYDPKSFKDGLLLYTSFGIRLKLPFKSEYIDKKSNLYYLCQTYRYR